MQALRVRPRFPALVSALTRSDRTVVRGDGPDAIGADRGDLPRGTTVDRYVVLSRLGAGAMGVVYGAYDPDLDRKVAIKVLHPDCGGRGSRGATRLLREAQALARLSHPNAVAIYDVGTRDGDVWLAMEFVAGQTLGAWLRGVDGRRGWAEVLDVLQPVALGLAAAHRAGLVHRDVKPDNVMIADDGRVRVMDFGLARGCEDASSEEVDEEQSTRARPRHRPMLDLVTGGGATPGTPAYMAPEQIAGWGGTDARADQFAYCVMLWEALYGARPFPGERWAELATNMLEGNLRPRPKGVRVPGWLRRIVRRGLAVNPDDRWPSMEALLQALRRGRARARRCKLAAVALALGGLAAAGIGLPRAEANATGSCLPTLGATATPVSPPRSATP